MEVQGRGTACLDAGAGCTPRGAGGRTGPGILSLARSPATAAASRRPAPEEPHPQAGPLSRLWATPLGRRSARLCSAFPAAAGGAGGLCWRLLRGVCCATSRADLGRKACGRVEAGATCLGCVRGRAFGERGIRHFHCVLISSTCEPSPPGHRRPQVIVCNVEESCSFCIDAV